MWDQHFSMVNCVLIHFAMEIDSTVNEPSIPEARRRKHNLCAD